MTALEAILRDRSVNLKKIANELGRSRPTLWRWSRGHTRPSKRDLRALADYLDVEADALLDTVIFDVQKRTRSTRSSR